MSTLYLPWDYMSTYHSFQSKRFVDQCKVRVQGGQGGNGLVSFLRASHAEFGGPDGGNGGNGGHVIFSSM